MALFMFQGSNLEESLKSTVIVKNLDDLRNILWEQFKIWEGIRTTQGKIFDKNSFDIIIENYNYDSRIGWHTQLVSIEMEGNGKFSAIGYLSEPLN